ncbi:hypothetical protein HYS90_01315, partial [Candidatus Curtissbacteria bacterium]|nr:hypothetical protein [Candidatus Curtissbacteria bacterium]
MTLDKAILATLAYHDIFDYPLSVEEIHKFLISQSTTHQSVARALRELLDVKKINQHRGHYFLKGRRSKVSTRKSRGNYSRAKFTKAQFFASILKMVPTVKLVAISGALAMQNSQKDDDIDFVIVSAKGSIWTTRFLANLALLPFKRDPQGEKVTNRACLNLFLDEGSLKIKDQNLYIAHEICQMKLLWDRDNTYQKFIEANG